MGVLSKAASQKIVPPTFTICSSVTEELPEAAPIISVPTTTLQPVETPIQILTVDMPFGLPPSHVRTSITSLNVERVESFKRILYIQPGTLGFQGVMALKYVFGPIGVEELNKQLNGIVNVLTERKVFEKQDTKQVQFQLKSNVLQYCVDVEEVADEFTTTTETNIFERLYNFASGVARQIGQLDFKELGLEGFGTVVEKGVEYLQKSGSALANVISGGRADLPKFWESSSFSGRYTFTIHLMSPTADKYTIFKKIVVPLALLLMLCTPKLMGSRIIMGRPPIVRAYVPGVCFIPAGYITNVSVERSRTYTVDGLPMYIQVKVEVQYLYNTVVQMFDDSGNTTEIVSTGEFSRAGAMTIGAYLASLLDVNTQNYELTKEVEQVIHTKSTAAAQTTSPTQTTTTSSPSLEEEEEGPELLS